MHDWMFEVHIAQLFICIFPFSILDGTSNVVRSNKAAITRASRLDTILRDS